MGLEPYSTVLNNPATTTHPGRYYGVLRSTRVVPVIFRRQISNVAGVKHKSYPSLDSWLFPASKKVYICIFLTSITEVITVGLTSVKKTVKIQNFRAVSHVGTLYTLFLSMEYIFL